MRKLACGTLAIALVVSALVMWPQNGVTVGNVALVQTASIDPSELMRTINIKDLPETVANEIN